MEKQLDAIGKILVALQAQVEIINAMISNVEQTPAAPAEPTPAKKRGRPAGKKQEPVIEEKEEDHGGEENDSEEESDQEDSFQEEPKKGASKEVLKLDKAAVVKALQTFAARPDKSRALALKVLSKFGATSVHDLDVSKYAEIIAALK